MLEVSSSTSKCSAETNSINKWNSTPHVPCSSTLRKQPIFKMSSLNVNIWMKFLFDVFICCINHGFRIYLLNKLASESVKWTKNLVCQSQTCENNVSIKHGSCKHTHTHTPLRRCMLSQGEKVGWGAWYAHALDEPSPQGLTLHRGKNPVTVSCRKQMSLRRNDQNSPNNEWATVRPQM